MVPLLAELTTKSLPHPSRDSRVESATAGTEEDGVRTARPRHLGAPAEPGVDRLERRNPDGYGALLPALAEHPDGRPVAIDVAEGWALTGETPLAVDAWGGPGLRLGAVELPPAGAVTHEDGTTEPGLAGRVEVRLAFDVRPEAASGEHPLAVSLRYRACGEGTCLPERALALTVPVRVVGR